MAGYPLDAMALIGIGFRNLSLVPSSIGPVKAMVRSLELGSLERYLRTISDIDHRSVRKKLKNFAQDHQVEI